LNGEPVSQRLKAIAAPSILTDLIAGAVILGLSVLVFNPLLQADFARLGITSPATPTPPAWQGLLLGRDRIIEAV